MAEIDYQGREDVLGAIQAARNAGEWAEVKRLGSLDEEFQVLHLTPKAWAATARSAQEQAIQFPRVLRSLWHDAPEVVETQAPSLPLWPMVGVCAAVLAGVLLWSGRGLILGTPAEARTAASPTEHFDQIADDAFEALGAMYPEPATAYRE